MNYQKHLQVKSKNSSSEKNFEHLNKVSRPDIIREFGHMIMIEKAFEMREKVLEF